MAKRLDRPEVRKSLLDALREGANDADAAMAAGLDRQTVRVYLLECGEDGASEDKSCFSCTVREARSHRHLIRLGLLNEYQKDKENPATSIRALELGFRMSGHLSGPGGPSVAVELGEDGRPTRIRASSGADLQEMSDDDLVVEHGRMTKGES